MVNKESASKSSPESILWAMEAGAVSYLVGLSCKVVRAGSFGYSESPFKRKSVLKCCERKLHQWENQQLMKAKYLKSLSSPSGFTFWVDFMC